MKLSISLLLLLFSATTLSTEDNQPLSNSPLTIGANIYLPIPPYSWINTCKQQPNGGVYKRLGRVLESTSTHHRFVIPEDFPDTSYLSARQQIAEGKFDAAFFPYIYPDYTDLIFVETPIIQLHNMIISKKSKPVTAQSYQGLKNFKGAITGTAKTNNIAREAQRLNLPITSTNNFKESMALLNQGETDYFITDRFYYQAMLSEQTKEYDFHQSPAYFLGRKIYLGISASPKHQLIADNLAKVLASDNHARYSNFVYGEMLGVWLARDPDCIYQTLSAPPLGEF